MRAMDDQRVGALLRALRIRRGLRQIDVAAMAGLSDQTISRIERGRLEALSIAALRRVTRVLEARLDLVIWTRAGDVERIASSSHAALVDVLISDLSARGWIARPEVSFSVYGERGLIDVAAWHEPSQTFLVIEVKTAVVDVGELLGTLDRKRRLAPQIARQLGWSPADYATALVVSDTTTNHRRIREHAATFGSTLPDSGQRFRSFIRRPTGTLEAVAFWPNRHPGSVRRPSGPVRRVRRPALPVPRSRPRSAQHC